jgi:DNA-binding NtrC family response regulator
MNFLSVLLSQARALRSVISRTMTLKQDLLRSGKSDEFITRDSNMQDLLSGLCAIAQHKSSVIIAGESGTGKEIIAQKIHDLSRRSEGPFIKLNCAAIAESLIERELFGIVNNTATGVKGSEGKFAAADGGTLFLDEIGDMPLDTQAKILRVIEYGEFHKVGSNRAESVDVRFIYATNKDLTELIRLGKFREDLYYRMKTFVLVISPLRERPDDIMLLAEYFAGRFREDSIGVTGFSNAVIECLLTYSWPGNVRELRNMIERLSITCAGRVVERDDLPQEITRKIATTILMKSAAEAHERARIVDYLKLFKWNKSEAARALQMPESTLRRKIAKYDIHKHSH